MKESDSIIIDSLVKPTWLANEIAQLPQYEQEELAELVAEEQKPGSFGELVKNAVGLTTEHQTLIEQEGSNVVSFYRKPNVA